MKLERDQKAIQAFTKTAQQQPENGDAWNNIAALCMKVSLLLQTDKQAMTQIQRVR